MVAFCNCTLRHSPSLLDHDADTPYTSYNDSGEAMQPPTPVKLAKLNVCSTTGHEDEAAEPDNIDNSGYCCTSLFGCTFCTIENTLEPAWNTTLPKYTLLALHTSWYVTGCVKKLIDAVQFVLSTTKLPFTNTLELRLNHAQDGKVSDDEADTELNDMHAPS